MDEELPFNMRTPAIITPKPNVPKPKFKPSRQNVETLINILRFKNDGTQLKFPPEVTNNFNIGGQITPSFYEEIVKYIEEKFDGAKSDFDDLLLEAALPCKRYFMEKVTIPTIIYNSRRVQELVSDGEIDVETAKFMITSAVGMLGLIYTAPFENLYINQDKPGSESVMDFKDGVGIGFKPGSHTREEEVICNRIVKQVGEALNDPKNQGRNAKVVRREVWNSLINKQYGVGRFLHRKHPRLTKKAKKVKKGKTRKYIR